jgi:hypothetical protein
MVYDAVVSKYREFRNEMKPKNAPEDFNEVLQNKSQYKELFESFSNWAKTKLMLNELNFIVAVDKFKENPTWEEAARIAGVYLSEDFNNKNYVNVPDNNLVVWIRSCCAAAKMLPRKS